ncbi:M1 family metallopeptidase [Conexibacter sp. JD483]|uniref:M1 family metallopeptidase n=1 Tax=unclassified Conexibacter TaxID=2627773 RepID=UPI0027178575|nr:MULTISPECIES: M1 family metallopeptidase [unclassified Conexibacter]MDO8184111.1 M1 family metallopeptidase [Conexibacter sp. CPCC 205706]MDO8197103.1 M1 family metallopeptidase [Conexibacter sp. CPCC 205762]MDR9367582.1 M1 family metallopeptidase [Conexibacter sp. JD483]
MTDARRAFGPCHRAAIAAVLLLAAGTASAAPATAAPSRAKPARLTVAAVRASTVRLDARRRFSVRATVVNRGSRASPAQLQLTLRAPGNPSTTWSLGGARIASLRAGKRRAVTLRAVAPTLREAFPKGLVLELCVRTKRGGPAVCAKDSRRIRLSVPARPPAPPAPQPPVTPPGGDPTVYTAGARTLNDSLFPTIGNGGYDATHYDLDLAYTNILTRVLRATAAITATATQNLSEFSFDFQGLVVTGVTVNGAPATFAYDFDNAKLVVTPASGIRSGAAFTTRVSYSGPPGPVIDPDGSSEGWLSNIDYGAVSLGEPLGSQGWFPVNNVPTDKATYDIAVTTASDFQAVSNGVLAGSVVNGNGTTTYRWHGGEPMAPYLASVSIGRFDTSGSDFSNPDRPLYIYVDDSFVRNRAAIVADQQRVPAILDWYAGYYGVPYPFRAAGGVVPRVSASLGYVLETQTKPTYPDDNPNSPGVGIDTIAHENAHQWFGNLVTLAQWKDIWLNEGITEFSSWLWSAEDDGGDDMPTRFAAAYDDYDDQIPDYWKTPPAAPPTAADIFDTAAMYLRGAATMTAIREIFIATPSLGEPAFRAMMRSWLVDHANGNVTTEQFTALVKSSDPSRAARWEEFFREWLYTSYSGDPNQPGNKPSITPANF